MAFGGYAEGELNFLWAGKSEFHTVKEERATGERERGPQSTTSREEFVGALAESLTGVGIQEWMAHLPVAARVDADIVLEVEVGIW